MRKIMLGFGVVVGFFFWGLIAMNGKSVADGDFHIPEVHRDFGSWQNVVYLAIGFLVTYIFMSVIGNIICAIDARRRKRILDTMAGIK